MPPDYRHGGIKKLKCLLLQLLSGSLRVRTSTVTILDVLISRIFTIVTVDIDIFRGSDSIIFNLLPISKGVALNEYARRRVQILPNISNYTAMKLNMLEKVVLINYEVFI